jgi:hypothetical protein
MDSHNADKLLEQGLSGDPPGQAFRARVLLDSTAALARRRRIVAGWRTALLSAAAVVVASVSFLLGRGSVGPLLPPPVTGPVAANEGGAVVVSAELVAWLQAAQTFRQLGMQDRMARAVERAGRLLPADVIIADNGAGEVFVAAGSVESQKKLAEPMDGSGPRPSAEGINPILAQSLGD